MSMVKKSHGKEKAMVEKTVSMVKKSKTHFHCKKTMVGNPWWEKSMAKNKNHGGKTIDVVKKPKKKRSMMKKSMVKINPW